MVGGGGKVVLTKSQAIEEHRKMWNWIADETERRREVVFKEDYFGCFGFDTSKTPQYMCWCCEYTKCYVGCNKCPIEWPYNDVYNSMCLCLREGSPYAKWSNAVRFRAYQSAAKYARAIANLPES